MSPTLYPNGLYASLRRKIFLAPAKHQNEKLAHILQESLRTFGYELDDPALQAASRLSAQELGNLYKELFYHLAHLRGLDLEFTPLHQQESLLPRSDSPSRAIPLGLGSQEDFFSIFTFLLQSTVNLSYTEKEILEWFVATYHEAILAYLPTHIPTKDNLALILGVARTKTHTLNLLVDRLVQTPSDVLRAFEAWSADSKAEDTRRGRFHLPSLPRRIRRILLQKLEAHPETESRLATNPEIWKRIGERLHPGEFQQIFPKAYKAFTAIRRKQPAAHFTALLEKAFQQGDDPQILSLLSSRPGEFARRLDRCLSRCKNSVDVLRAFRLIGARIPSRILIGLWEYYLNRNHPEERGIVLKHSPVVKFLPPKPPLSTALVEQTITTIKHCLVARFAAHPSLGACYLDPGLKAFAIPLSKRHASSNTSSLPSGTRLVCTGPALRFFIWWQEEKGSRADIDLAACLLDKNFRWQSDLSYYHLNSGWGFHSGDITSAPDGACEFIDIDLTKVTSRYLVMGVYSYTGQTFASLPKCLAGWQSQLLTSNQPTKLSQADQIINLKSSATSSIPMVIDLDTKEIIWTDLALHARVSMHNSFSAQGRLGQACRQLVQRQRVSLFDLLDLHIQARGRVATPDQAQTCFTAAKLPAASQVNSTQTTYSGWNPDEIVINFLV